MRKVAIIAPNTLPVPPIRGGGVQKVIAETAPLYKEFKPYIFSNSEYGLDNLPLVETAGNIEHRRISKSRWEELMMRIRFFSTRNYFPYVYLISQQIKEIKPDLIHICNRPWFIPILRKYLGPDVKIILHHFNNYFSEMPAWAARKFLDRIDGFIACSKFTLDLEILKRFPALGKMSFVVSNGVDTGKFDPANIRPATVQALRKKYGIKNDDIVILYVGRLSEGKGALPLLEAVKKLILRDGIRNLKLLIVGSSFYGGSSSQTPFIRKLYSVSGDIKDNIVFTGFIDSSNIMDIFALGSIVAVPSIVHDASPVVCYEGSSMKLPIVATRRGGIPEIVEDGSTGLLYDNPMDTEKLAEKLHYFIKNPQERRAFGERGRAFMEKNYTWKIVAGKLEKVYNLILNQRSK